MRDGLRWSGRLIADDIIGVHTLSLLASSRVAHDRTTEPNHTHQTGSRILYLLYTVHKPLTYCGSESGSNLNKGILDPFPCG